MISSLLAFSAHYQRYCVSQNRHPWSNRRRQQQLGADLSPDTPDFTLLGGGQQGVEFFLA